MSCHCCVLESVWQRSYIITLMYVLIDSTRWKKIALSYWFFFSLFSNFVPGMISIKHSFFFLKSAHTYNNVSLVDYTGALVANEFYYFLLPFCNSGFELFRKKNCIYIHLFFDLKGKIYPFLSHLTILKNVRNSQKYQNVCI